MPISIAGDAVAKVCSQKQEKHHTPFGDPEPLNPQFGILQKNGGLAFCGFSFSTVYSVGSLVVMLLVYPHVCTFVLVPMCPLLRYGLEFEPVVGFDLLGVYLQGRRPAPALRLTSEGLWPIVSRMQA